MLSTVVASTAFGSAVVFGFRHGFDWDHLAALTDLTGSQSTARRSMWLATLYAVGHALMVLVLGVAAILFAEQVPGSVDTAMERVVGVSLIALGLWMAWTALRTRGVPPLRSRWMAVIATTRSLGLRARAGDELVVIEHTHDHDHDRPDHVHTHEHLHLEPRALSAFAEQALTATAVGHRHAHRHVVHAAVNPFAVVTSRSAFGVGMLHGVGAETPTQVLIFATAANSGGRPTSIALLGCFIVGLLAANTLVAAASTFGFRRVLAHRGVSIVLGVATAGFSLAVGTMLLTGHGASLPGLSGVAGSG